MSNKEAVKKWRKITKDRIVASMGGCCQICGYAKCPEALELHHINPSEKEFSMGAMRANPMSWDKIVTELRKCILLCSNCHREIHSEITFLPENYKTFDESFVDYKSAQKEDSFDECPCCGKNKPIQNTYCSYSCAAKNRGKVDWDSIDLEYLVKTKNLSEIGRMLGVSGVAVKKRLYKLREQLSTKQ